MFMRYSDGYKILKQCAEEDVEGVKYNTLKRNMISKSNIYS